MSPDPEYLPPEYVSPSGHSVGRAPAQAGGDDEDLNHRSAAEGVESYVVPAPELPRYFDDRQQIGANGFYAVPGFFNLDTRPQRARLIPNAGHALIFFVLALLLINTGEGLSVWMGHSLHLFGNASFSALAADARLTVPAQMVEYLAIFGFCALLFSMLWHRPFLEGIHWNAPVAIKRIAWLVPLGIVMCFCVGLGGSFLPMPKDAPIVQDIGFSTAGAWLMFVFSFTGAPLMEELAFRGFLMPSLANSFRWMSDRGWLPQAAVNWIGLPIAVLLTSLCFALLHGPQLAHSWAPVLLIGIVSVVLCLVRLSLDSVLASAIVHAAYNFTLFAGILYNTDGFRHLDKIKG